MLSDAGIMPPPTMPDRPKVKLEDIPAGIRLSDLEIAAALAVDIGVSLPTCSTIIGVSIREDVAALFVKYHAKKIIFATETMRLSKEKGWLIPPPLQLKRPENDNSK